MKVEKIITTTQQEELDITEATLLSTEEALRLPERLRGYKQQWWLRSPGYKQNKVTYTYFDGTVNYIGYDVEDDYFVARPALKINLKSSNLQIGNKFIFGEKEFEIISNELAFCTTDIGYCCFREDWRLDDANVYEKSDVKKFVDKWFESSKQK